MILWCRNIIVGRTALMINGEEGGLKRDWKMHTLEMILWLCRFFGEACILRMVLWSMRMNGVLIDAWSNEYE